MSELATVPSALRDFKDIPPPTFDQEKGGGYMLSRLSQRKLWKERPRDGGKDPILFINFQSGRRYGFDGNSLATTEADDVLNKGEGFNGVVVVTAPLGDSDKAIERELIEAVSSLKPGGSVFLFEKPEGRLEKQKDFVDKKPREEILERVGLVEREVLNSGRAVPGAVLWEAHMPKDKGLTHPIDLLEAGPSYVKEMIEAMKNSYRDEGWSVVDFENSELYKKLKKSNFPLKDIHAIRDRFGVRLKSDLCPTSTCEGVVPIDTGSLELINSCGEEHFVVEAEEHNDSVSSQQKGSLAPQSRDDQRFKEEKQQKIDPFIAQATIMPGRVVETDRKCFKDHHDGQGSTLSVKVEAVRQNDGSFENRVFFSCPTHGKRYDKKAPDYKDAMTAVMQKQAS